MVQREKNRNYLVAAIVLAVLYMGTWIWGLDWPAFPDSQSHTNELFLGFPDSYFPLVAEQLKDVNLVSDYYYQEDFRDVTELFRTQLVRVHIDWLTAKYQLKKLSAEDRKTWSDQGFYDETPYWWKPRDIKPSNLELYSNDLLTIAYDNKTKIAYIRKANP